MYYHQNTIYMENITLKEKMKYLIFKYNTLNNSFVIIEGEGCPSRPKRNTDAANIQIKNIIQVYISIFFYLSIELL